MIAARTALLRYLPLLLLAAAWELSSRLGLISSLVLPSLSKVIEAWIELIKDGDLITNGLASLYRGGVGLLLSIVVGAALGIVMAWWKPINTLLSPLVEMFYPMPKSALIPVTVIWLGFGDGSKILLIFLGCMLPVTIGAYNGARGADRQLVWSARSMGASRGGLFICGRSCLWQQGEHTMRRAPARRRSIRWATVSTTATAPPGSTRRRAIGSRP